MPYFIAAKLEAFSDRGKGDFYGSHDMEDIITVLDGSKSAEQEIFDSPDLVRKYISVKLNKYLSDPFFSESIEGHLEGPTRGQRARLLEQIIIRIAGGRGA